MRRSMNLIVLLCIAAPLSTVAAATSAPTSAKSAATAARTGPKAAAAETQPNRSNGLLGLGMSMAPTLGATVPTNKLEATLTTGLNVGYRLPLLGRLLGIAFDFAYLKPGFSGSGSDATAGGDYEFDLKARYFIFAIEAVAVYDVGALVGLDGINAFGGIGYGFYVLQSTMKAFGMANTETQVRGGTQIHGGAGYTVGPGEIFGQLRYHYSNFRFVATGRKNAGGLTFALGYRLLI